MRRENKGKIMKVKLYTLIALWAMFVHSPCTAKTIYVNSVCGNDLWTGQTPACDAPEPTGPVARISQAVMIANPGDTISVADGIYLDGDIFLPDHITVKSENGPEASIINCGNNAPAFICNFGGCSIEGFTIMNGYDDAGGAIQCNTMYETTRITNCIFTNCYARSFGGAISIVQQSSVNIQHCTFNNCAASEGGAIFAEDNSSLTIDLCTFENNTGYDSGGAIALYNASATILDTDFDNNRSQQEFSSGGRGGAIAASNSILYLSYCNFNNNVSIEAGGALYCAGQGAVSLSNCVFTGNRLTENYWPEGGGAISAIGDISITAVKSIFNNNYAALGGAVAVVGTKTHSFTTCVFSSNTADEDGGAIYCMGLLHLKDCLLKYNHADNGMGGALSVWGGNVQLSNCDISGNVAQYISTFAITGPSNITITNSLITGNRSIDGGAAISADQSTLSLTNVTIADNAPVDMPVIAVYQMITPVTLKNAILHNQSWPPIELINAPEPMISYTNFDNEAPVDLIAPGVGNLSEDPLFVQSGHFMDTGIVGDDRDDTWVEGDYHLKSQAGRWNTASQTWVYDDVSSPCIDAADPLDETKDEPFPHGDRRNMGAYGASQQASKSPVCAGAIPGDTNNDCKVDFEDFAAVAAHWMECNKIPQTLCW